MSATHYVPLAANHKSKAKSYVTKFSNLLRMLVVDLFNVITTTISNLAQDDYRLVLF